MKLITHLTSLDGPDLQPTYPRLTNLPLIIMVGLTGVGKTTTLQSLADRGLEFYLLPNRRQITDQFVIAQLQQASGQPVQPVTDRLERFSYTARYREQYPGGLAYALSRLAITEPLLQDVSLIFDGLRGLNEVQHAASYFPQARFIVLDAPDRVRLSRLLTRGDQFDVVAQTIPSSAANDLYITLTTIPDIQQVFDEATLTDIASLPDKTDLTAEAIIKKTKIIVEERRNYDSQAAQQYLCHHVPAGSSFNRVLMVDTATYPPEIVGQQIAAYLRETSPIFG